MVLDIIIDNMVNYVFGSRILFGLAVVLAIVVGAIITKIDKSAILLVLTPLVLVAGKEGYLSPMLTVIAFIGIFMLWGIMFKLILQKK